MKKTAWNLTLELIGVLSDIDNLVEVKGKESDINKEAILDKKIDILENRMFDIKNKLKSVEV